MHFGISYYLFAYSKIARNECYGVYRNKTCNKCIEISIYWDFEKGVEIKNNQYHTE